MSYWQLKEGVKITRRRDGYEAFFSTEDFNSVKSRRVRKEKNGPRAIDLDILFYGDLVYESLSLLIPHPKIDERLFVIEPFCDLAPDFVHPGKGLTMAELKDEIEMAMPQGN